MKRSEIADLLTMVAATHGRTASMADIQTWEAILPPDMTFPDAREAFLHHCRNSDDFFVPKHVIDFVGQARRERLQRAGTPPIPGDLTWSQEKAWRQLWCANVKDGMEPATAAESVPLELQPATSDAVAEERKALVAKLAESKAAPKAKPEDFKAKKPRTRWGCWSRGSENEPSVIEFAPDGQVLYHELGPYGIELGGLDGSLGFWLQHMQGKGCDGPCLIALTEAYIHIFDAAPEIAHEILDRVRNDAPAQQHPADTQAARP